MKKILISIFLAMVLALGLGIQPANATTTTLSLKAQWNAPTDDTTGVKLSCYTGSENWYSGNANGDGGNNPNEVWTPGPVLTTGTLIPIPTVSLVL
ncbi:MAG: hypothetical protein ABSG44_09990 [Thermodesulfobacteriota bacterium]|jgi:hypothetical protein